MDRDRLTIFVIEGRTYLYCLRSEVEIGSRSQEVSGKLNNNADTSSMVAGGKKGSPRDLKV